MASATTARGSIEEAGNGINSRYCKHWPNTNESFFLPKYPKVNEKHAEVPSDFDNINIYVERRENYVHNVFRSLVQSTPTYPILCLPCLSLDGNGIEKGVKENALRNELPAINLTSGSMRREYDLFVLVKNLGVVVAQVRRSTHPYSNRESAEVQLKDSYKLIQGIWHAVAAGSANIPTCRLIIFPGETSKSPTSPTVEGSYLFYKDALENINNKWESVVLDLRLRSFKSRISIKDRDFQRLVDIITGLWSMKVVSSGFTFDEPHLLGTDQLVQGENMIDDSTDDFSNSGNALTRIPTLPVATIPASSAVHHLAPVGSSYASAQDAGNSIVKRYCDSYPFTSKSFLLPNYLKNKYPELSSETKDSNKLGERAEQFVHKFFQKLTWQTLPEPFLGLVGVGLDNDNSRKIKQKILSKEGINLSSVEMTREHDLILLVKNLGVVVAEVKRSANQENIDSAKEQLKNSDKLIQCFWQAIRGSTYTPIPTCKLILISSKRSTDPTVTTPEDCYVFYKDDLDDITNEWEAVVTGLRSQVVNPIDENDFQRLVDIATGLWSMKVIKKVFHYDEIKASEAEQILAISNRIDIADIVSKTGKKTTKLHETKQDRTFREMCDITLLYLTPDQKDVFDRNKVILRGHSGSGKSILLMLKMLETLHKMPNEKMVVAAPHPHHLRLHQFLVDNNISSQVVKRFPYLLNKNVNARTPTSNVLVMSLNDLFGVDESTLKSYDLRGLHLLLDDLQGYRVTKGRSDFEDIASFIEETYKLISKNNTEHLLWVCLDSAQQLAIYPSEQELVTSMFKKRSENLAKLEFQLTQVLRNSENIISVVKEARSLHVRRSNLDKFEMIPEVIAAHEIYSHVVIQHRLKAGCPFDRHSQFVCERVGEQVKAILDTEYQNQYKKANIAVLFEVADDRQQFLPSLQDMISTMFGAKTQSIEELISTKDLDSIVVDVKENVNSFECPVVIVVTDGNGQDLQAGDGTYNLFSRALTKLIIVNTNKFSNNLTFVNTDPFEWEWDHREFKMMPQAISAQRQKDWISKHQKKYEQK